MNDKDTPTNAHSNLMDLLSEIEETGRSLPPMQKIQLNNNANNKSNGTTEMETRTVITYEDVLSTAILNKVVLNGQKRMKSDSPLSLVDSAVQTDSEFTTEEAGSELGDTRHHQYSKFFSILLGILVEKVN